MGFETDVCKECGRRFSHRANCRYEGDVEEDQLKKNN